jgi:hypothetical protein
MSYYIHNANTLSLTLKSNGADGFEVIGVEPSAHTNLVEGDTGEVELEIEWQAESTNATAELKFVGEFVPTEIKSSLPVSKHDSHHYTVKFNTIPLATAWPEAPVLVDSEICIFRLGMVESTGPSASTTWVSSSSESGTPRTGAVTRPRPDKLASSHEGGVLPSTPTVKLVLLPTRKTAMPGDMKHKPGPKPSESDRLTVNVPRPARGPMHDRPLAR